MLVNKSWKVWLVVPVLMLGLAAVFFTVSANPESSAGRSENRGSFEGPRESSAPVDQVRTQISTLAGKLNDAEAKGEIDFGLISQELQRSGFDRLNAAEMLEVLDALSLPYPATGGQSAHFLLQSAAELLRDGSDAAHVRWVSDRLDSARQPSDIAKWLVVLELMANGGNQGAYVGLLAELDREPLTDLNAKEAEVVGRVLGRNGNTDAVRELLKYAVKDEGGARIAVDSSIGYVQSSAAIETIAEVIDGSGKKNGRQMSVAIEMLGYIPSEYSAMSLRNLSSDPDENVARPAWAALELVLSNNPALRSAKTP